MKNTNNSTLNLIAPLELKRGLNIKTDTSWIKLDDSHLTNIFDIKLIDSDKLLHKGVSLVEENNSIKNISDNTEDFFDQLNYQKSKRYKLKISNKTSIKDPITIIKNFESNIHTNLIIEIGEESDVLVYVKNIKTIKKENIKTGSQEKTFDVLNDYITINVKDNSKAYILNQRIADINTLIVSKSEINLQANTNMEYLTIDGESKLTLVNQKSNLIGENSRSIMNNIVLGKNKSEYNINTVSEHSGKGTYSLMQGKGVLNNSKSILRGLVKINDTAFNSNGYQKSDYLIIGENSRAIAIPDLEIHNNEVKCTHGSTITKLDSEKIFYMESRGISKELSEEILTEGFYDKILSDIPNEELKENIRIELKNHKE